MKLVSTRKNVVTIARTWTTHGIIARFLLRLPTTTIADMHKKYDDIQSGWREGKYKDTDRNLMIDGLMKQFITQVDEA